MQASLVMFKANGERKDFPLTKPVTVVGRKNTCDLRIPLGAVSRQHFQVERDGATLKLKDLGSSNGTYHNGERVLESELEAGDQVQVGPVTFIVEMNGMPKNIEPIKTVLPEESDVHSSAEVNAEALSDSVRKKEAVSEDSEDSDILADAVEQESQSQGPTMVESDDSEGEDEEDPIAALEALAGSEDDEEEDEAIAFIEDEEEEEEEKSR